MGANFNRSMLLARANIRKAKGQTVAIVALVLLSSIMMNLWLMLSTDYKKNFDRSLDELNDGHVNIVSLSDAEDFRDFLSDELSGDNEVTGFTSTDAYFANVLFDYNENELATSAVMLKKSEALSRAVGKFEITEDSGNTSGIYLPMLYGTGNNYSVGDTFKTEIGGEKYEYTVCGFFNSPMLGSHNCGGMLSFLFTEDKFEEFSEEFIAYPATYTSVRLKDKADGENFSAKLKDKISEEFTAVSTLANYYQMVNTARYTSQTICAGIFSAMAFLVLLIGAVVIASNVANYIQENMKNLGALKALGYTSGQIVSSIIVQFASVSVIAAAVGAALSYLIFPAVSDMMIAQTGIPYEVKFLPIPFICTVILILAIVAAAVYLSANKIRKIEPIMALRQGIATHSFKKNHLPLDKTSLPVNFALAVKTMLSSLKQNVTVCITMLVISLMLVFCTLAVRNVVVDVQLFIDIIAGESADSAIQVNYEREEDFLSELESDSRVAKYYLYTNADVQHAGGVSLHGYITDDCSKLNNQTVFVEGRYPQYGNEAAIAIKYARENGIKTGDEITLKAGNKSEKYIVSGFTQNANDLGKDCMLTREGYEKIGELSGNATYYLNLTEGEDIDKFNSEISDEFGGDIPSTINVRNVLASMSGVYVSLMTVLVIGIIIISCAVIIFVMYLLVRTMLNGKKRDYGILKALGFTTGQLVVQTALSFMPSVIISTVVGIIISMQIINPIMALFLSGIGFVKGTFIIPVSYNIIAGIGLIVFAFCAACLLSRRVKKITPHELLTGE